MLSVPTSKDSMQSDSTQVDKENEPHALGTPGGANLRAKQLGPSKRPVSSILTPLGKKGYNSGTPGKGLLRDITNSAHLKRLGEQLKDIPDAIIREELVPCKPTSLRKNNVTSMEELLALPDDQLPDIEVIARPPARTLDDLEGLPAFPDIPLSSTGILPAEPINWNGEIARVLKDIQVDPADFEWALKEYRLNDKVKFPPCFLFDDIPPTVNIEF